MKGVWLLDMGNDALSLDARHDLHSLALSYRKQYQTFVDEDLNASNARRRVTDSVNEISRNTFLASNGASFSDSFDIRV